jgi:putative glutamine amidotransferase
MPPAPTPGNTVPPRIGIPWRTSQEQRQGERKKLDYYFEAVKRAGAEPSDIRLDFSPAKLSEQLASFDGFVLPGSPADVNPARYGSAKHFKINELDEDRDLTDFAILRHAFETAKPVLAICFGCQSLNVYLKGTLIQDLRSQRPESIAHGDTDLPPGAVHGDIQHPAEFVSGSLLARLAGSREAKVNSSHHQAIDTPGDNLRVAATAPDGTIEAVEWTGRGNWIVGVQWHPERMPDDPLAQKLFTEFVAAVRSARAAMHQEA